MINDLNELKKLLKLCRKEGVTEITLGTVSLKLGDVPKDIINATNNALNDVDDDKYSGFPVGELSPTQLMFYSAGGNPEDDPELNQ